MGMIDSIFVPVEQNGVTFSLAASTASAAKTPPSRLFSMSSDQPTTVTFAKGTTTATTPSITVGFWMPANAIVSLDLGGGSNIVTSMKFFNTNAATAANICLTPWGM